jgi:large subunit ribosomal protein L18
MVKIQDLAKICGVSTATISYALNGKGNVSEETRQKVRVKKHLKMRNRFSGTPERPRLAVFRSNNHMYAQIIDDTVGNTLVAASTLEKSVKAELEKTNNVDAAAYLGTVIAKRALEKGINTVVFDRGGFIYQGKIAALAEAAREAGLEF